MEESEVPLEHLHEHIHQHAEHGGPPWISWAALSTAIVAVLAAIAGLLSGSRVNEAVMSQIQASDQWSYYQAKSIKAAVLEAKVKLENGASAQDREEIAHYAEEQEKIKQVAEGKQKDARNNFHQHEILARSVTMFQIAIAIAAISVLTKRRRFFLVSLLFGAAGTVFLVLGVLARGS